MPQTATEPIRLRRRLNLVDGTFLIVGTVIGTGIFIAPAAVLHHTGSVGLALLVWLVGGIHAILCGLCIIELGKNENICGFNNSN